MTEHEARDGRGDGGAARSIAAEARPTLVLRLATQLFVGFQSRRAAAGRAQLLDTAENEPCKVCALSVYRLLLQIPQELHAAG